MEQPMRCKTLTAIYKNEINTLKKLYEIDFLIHKSVRIHIEQFTVRKIEIDFTSEQLVDDLIAVLTKVERLLMLFDGYFMNLISIEFQDSAGCVPPNLKECAEHFMRRRLAYFHSNKILFSSNYLLDFSKVLTPALYEKWKGILEDLDVAHQVYLYSLCDTNQPVDLRCAFLIELAEPVVEIVKANSPLFESLNPGKQGTSLRDCLRALITTYGSDIFENEINSCFETFLKSLVNSRVRIMHIKRNSYKIVLTWRNCAIGYKNKQDIDMKDTERHHYIGEHICALRESKGWTQQTLGKKLGKKTSTISAYETNAKLPSADRLIEMAEVFGVSIDTLVYGETADLVSVRTLNPAQKALVAEILQVFGSNSSQKSASEQRLRLVGNLVNLLI